MTSYISNTHPSQYEVPNQPINTAYPGMYVPQTPQTYMEYTIGQKINKAFYITVCYLAFLHSSKFLENIYYLFTQKSFEFVAEETGKPTLKSYIVSSLLFFGIVFWILS